MGVDHHRAGELASAHLAVACARLPALRAESRGTSRHQYLAARCECGAFVSAAAMDDWLHLAEFDGCSAFCTASHQRGIGGLDLRAEEPAQHAVFPAGA